MTFQAGTGTPWPRVSVVVPALNEALNLPHVLALMPPNIHEVILIDGYSVDGTVAVARQLRPDVRVLMQTRKGKGNALACGFSDQSHFTKAFRRLTGVPPQRYRHRQL